MSRLSEAWAALRGHDAVRNDASGLTWDQAFPRLPGPNRPVSTDRALQSSAVFACVRIIAGTVMTCPLEIFEINGQERELVTDHPMLDVLSPSADSSMSGAQLWETATVQVLTEGQAYAPIRRKSSFSNAVRSLELSQPGRTSVRRKGGRLIYTNVNADGVSESFDQDDMLHLPGLGWDGTKALSPIAYHATTIGMDLNALEYSASYYDKGNLNDSYLTLPKKLTDAQVNQLRDMLQRRAGPDGAHEPLILGEGGEWKRAGMTARDAQLIEALQFSASDIARVFGVPPHMIGLTEKSTSWGTGLEQQVLAFITFVVNPHFTRFEAEINRKLFGGTPFRVEFNHEGLQRGDSTTRYENYQKALGGNNVPGWMAPNDPRRKEGMPPIVGGDVVYRPPEPEGPPKNET